MPCRTSSGFGRSLFLVLLLLSSLISGCTGATRISMTDEPSGAEAVQTGAEVSSSTTEAGGTDWPEPDEELPEPEPPPPTRAARVCPAGLGLGTAWGGIPADIAPTAHTAPPTPLPQESLEQTLQAYLQTLKGTYGVHVIDPATGAAASVNADQVFVAASTFKVPFAMYVVDLITQGETSLDEPLTYHPDDWEAGAGLIQNDLVEGDCYLVSELLDLMLTESDNIATNMLLRRYGEANAFQFMEQLGGTVTHLESGRRATTPREMAQYFAKAYQAAVDGDPLHGILVDRLRHTAFSDRIAAGAPEGVPVAHKVGTLPGMVHDVGVVLLPDRPVVLAIFSTGVDEAEAAVRHAEITSLVCDFVQYGGPGPAEPVEGTEPPPATPADPAESTEQGQKP